MTRLYDGLFPSQLCVHANGDNVGRAPQRVRWVREGDPGRKVWFTDSSLAAAAEVSYENHNRIAWLLEPREYHHQPYEYVQQHLDLFDFALTYDKEMLRDCPIALPYMFGGTRVAPIDQRLDHTKTEMVSIVASPKRGLPGHRLRHDLLQWSKVDAYGPEYAPIERKLKALAPYRFHVAIEAIRADWFFSEALLDAILTGCVPIYWGCPDIGSIFDIRGMIHCADLLELRDAVQACSVGLYDQMKPYLQANFERAQQYQLTEDWLFRAYPFLFDEELDGE